MQAALSRCEIASTITLVHTGPDEAAKDTVLVLFGERNYVRAAELTAEEVAADHCNAFDARPSTVDR